MTKTGSLPSHIYVSILSTYLLFLFTLDTARAILEYPSVTQNLTQHLLATYNPNVRPVLTYSESVTVTHALLLKQIVRLDTKTQTLRLFMHEYTSWVDNYLTWDPERFGNISVISVNRENLWIPDIIVFNQVRFKILQKSQFLESLCTFHDRESELNTIYE